MLKNPDKLDNMLAQVFKEELHSDVVFLCGQEEMKSHRLVLSAVSPLLSSIFANIPPEEEPALIVDGFQMEEIKHLLTFIYTGTHSLSTRGVEKLQQLLKTLGVELTLTIVAVESRPNPSRIDSDLQEGYNLEHFVDCGNETTNVLNDNNESECVTDTLKEEELENEEHLMDVSEEDSVAQTSDLNCEGAETREVQCEMERQESTSTGSKKVREKQPTCSFCPEVFSDKKLKLSHERGHPEAYFVCDLCGLNIFIGLKAAHARSHRESVCSLCDTVVANLKKHMNEKHRFVCEICGKKLTNVHRLNFHKEVCHSEGKVFACRNCSVTFKSKEELEEHDRTTTSRHQTTCPVCSATLGKKDYLNIRPHLISHAVTESETSKASECPRCNRHFPCTRYLQNHLLVHYIPEWKFECSKCFMVWKTRVLLKNHERGCNGEKKARKKRHIKKRGKVDRTCASCKKVFSSSLNAEFHFETVHNKKSACRKCWKMFDTKAERDEHIKIHEKGSKKYPCVICTKRFEACVMKLHLITHAKVEVKDLTSPKCPRCVRKFASMTQVQNHLLMHYQPQRKIECPHCCLAVRTEFELSQHEKGCEALYGKKKRVRRRAS